MPGFHPKVDKMGMLEIVNFFYINNFVLSTYSCCSSTVRLYLYLPCRIFRKPARDIHSTPCGFHENKVYLIAYMEVHMCKSTPS